jgi:hypothetical protein
MRNPLSGEHSNRRRHCLDPKRSGVKTFRSGMRDAQLTLPFWSRTNVFRYVTEELHSATAQYATGDEAIELCHVPRSRKATSISGRGVPFNIVV